MLKIEFGAFSAVSTVNYMLDYLIRVSTLLEYLDNNVNINTFKCIVYMIQYGMI